MTKNKRQQVYDKYGGKCAYCGCELGKAWHIDHLEPVNRISKMKAGYYRSRATKIRIEQSELPENWWSQYEYVNPKSVFDRMANPERDTVENSMPSCSSCNLYKSTFDLETFRQQVGLLVARLNKSFTQYKIAKRFGFVQEVKKPVVFYFETF